MKLVYVLLLLVLAVLFVSCGQDGDVEPVTVLPTSEAVQVEVAATLPATWEPVEAEIAATLPAAPTLVVTEVPVLVPTLSPTAVPTVELVPTLEVLDPGVRVVHDSLPSLEEFLALVQEAAAGVESVSYELKVVADVEDLGMSVAVGLEIVGDFQAPDRQHVSVLMMQGFFNIEMDMIVIGDDVYVKVPLSDKWELQGNVDGGLEGFDGMLESLRDVDVLEHLSLSGRGEVDGREVYFLEGEVGPELGDTVLGDLLDEVGTATLRYWFGVDDYLLYGSEMSVFEGELETKVSMKFWDYGKDLDIRAPDTAGRGLGEPDN